MIQQLKALVVILPIVFATFYVARGAFSKFIEPARIDQWRNLFLAVTTAGFLTPNFWAMLFVISLLVIVLGRREPVRPALYLLLLFALPPVGLWLPGFAGINNFLVLTPPFVLAAVILAPLLFYARRMNKIAPGGSLTDMFFLAYLALNVVLAFRETSSTDGVRNAITFFMYSAPAYFVLSRWPRSLPEIRVITLAAVLPLLALSAIAVAEFGLRWHFYSEAAAFWGADTGAYVTRLGFLRAYASVLGPIAFGFFLMAGLTLSLPLMASGARALAVRSGIAVFGAGLIVTLSRGPWIGAALAVAAFILSGPKAVLRFFMLGIGGVAALGAVSLTPAGSQILALLPFIGGEAGGTIDYRQRLADAGWRVVMENPLFGMEGVRQAEGLQEMIQGQGIVDLVNSYLAIALDSGLVGLTLFLGALLTALYSVWSASRRARAISEELSTYSRAYFATLLGILFVIGTTSSVAQVTEFYWVIAGLCVAMTRVTNAELAKAGVAAPVDEPELSGLEGNTSSGSQTARKTPSEAINEANLPAHLRQYVKK